MSQERTFINELSDYINDLEKLNKELAEKVLQKEMAAEVATDNNKAYFALKYQVQDLIEEIETRLKHRSPKYFKL